MKRVRVKYFAIFREQAGVLEEELNTGSRTAGDLYGELSLRFGFTLKPDWVRVSMNNRFSEMSNELKEGDVVVFIPPVAGG